MKKECVVCNKIKEIESFRSYSKYRRRECRMCELERKRIYRNTNKEELNLSFFKERANKINNRQKSNILNAEQLKKLFEDQKKQCYVCGEFLNGHNLQIEHIIAISKGGSSDISNIKCSCTPCNHLKKDRSLNEFVSFLIPYAQRVQRKLGNRGVDFDSTL